MVLAEHMPQTAGHACVPPTLDQNQQKIAHWQHVRSKLGEDKGPPAGFGRARTKNVNCFKTNKQQGGSTAHKVVTTPPRNPPTPSCQPTCQREL